MNTHEFYTSMESNVKVYALVMRLINNLIEVCHKILLRNITNVTNIRKDRVKKIIL